MLSNLTVLSAMKSQNSTREENFQGNKVVVGTEGGGLRVRS